jgi:serine/threonine protein kinase
VEGSDLTAPLATQGGSAGGPDLRPGAILGRYVVVEKLGAGSGGTVHAAFDSHLGRKVALKVLRSTAEELSGPLLREAQLIAALDHPNIVTVHDIGQSDGNTFIAMELVAGRDLSHWLRTHPPDGSRWRERLEPWLRAGRGLAAAHRAGVIHGDFKPANVLHGDDGRVRVTDFGIGRLAEGDQPSVDERDAAPPDSLWGTPLYMAPELFDGRPPDARSDLYAYCASVYEALYGEPPARGDDAEALVASKQTPPTPHDDRGVPARVLAILHTGLAAAPEKRGDVAQVVAALERAVRSRRSRLVAGVGVVALVGVTWAAFTLADAERPCTGAGERLAGVWDAQRRVDARAAFDASELAYAETAWRRFSSAVDQYAAAWSAAFTRVCESSVRGEQSDAVLDAKMSCLARRRAGLLALVNGVTGGSPSRVVKAGDAADRLEPVRTCLDLAQEPDELRPPSTQAEEVARIDELLVAVQTGIDLGDTEEAAEIAAEALARAETAGFRPLVARARFGLGRAYSRTGRYDEAAKLLEQAALGAEEVGDDETAGRAGLALMFVLEAGLDDAKAALAWAPHTEVALKRGRADPRFWGKFHDFRVFALIDLGRTEEAEDALALAIEEWRRVEGEYAASEVTRREAEMAALRGDLEGAIAKQRQAVAQVDEAAGWPSPDAIELSSGLAGYLDDTGQFEAALAEFEHAVEGAREALGTDHPSTGTLEANTAKVLSDLGRYEEALDYYTRARETLAKSVGEDHPRYAGVLVNISATFGHLGRDADAAKWAEKALGPIIAHFGEDHRITGYLYQNLGSARRRSGDARGAIEPLEKALLLVDDAGDRGAVQFELAQAIVATDRPRALNLGRSAQKNLQEAARIDEVAEVARWLQDPGAAPP